MTKNEFMEYTQYLGKILKISIPTDKDELAAWFEPFKNTHLEIGKKMAQLYLEKEQQGMFKLSKLLGYKSLAMAGKTYNEPVKSSCSVCGGIGLVEIKPKAQEGKYPYIKNKRCLCAAGGMLPGYINQVTREELVDMEQLLNGTWLILKD